MKNMLVTHDSSLFVSFGSEELLTSPAFFSFERAYERRIFLELPILLPSIVLTEKSYLDSQDSSPLVVCGSEESSLS